MKWFFLFVTIFLLFNTNLVVGDLLVSPSPMDLSVYKGVEKSFNLSFVNNNSFELKNVSFTNISGFQFNSVDSLLPFESRSVVFKVLSGDVFDRVSVSTVSFFYDVAVSSDPKIYVINISGNSFGPSNLSIEVNDSVVWVNQNAFDVELKDLNSGFSVFSVPAFQNRTLQYSSVASYGFYEFPLGFTGFLNVRERSNVSLAHDSSKDKVLVFNVHSSLNPSSVLLSLLPNNLSLEVNQSMQGVLEIRNLETQVQVFKINLSDSLGWVSFSENGFDLLPGTNKLVFFNVSPKVSRTNETDFSWVNVITASSLNAGNVSTNLNVFVKYKNFDIVNINGTQYLLNVLGINDTINACRQHDGEPGFEMCSLIWKDKNVTIVKEIEPMYKFSESEISMLKNQTAILGESNLRTENLNNRYLDKTNQLMDIIEINVTSKILKIEKEINDHNVEDKKSRRKTNILFGTIFGFILLIYIWKIIGWFMANYEEFQAKVDAGQF